MTENQILQLQQRIGELVEESASWQRVADLRATARDAALKENELLKRDFQQVIQEMADESANAEKTLRSEHDASLQDLVVAMKISIERAKADANREAFEYLADLLANR